MFGDNLYLLLYYLWRNLSASFYISLNILISQIQTTNLITSQNGPLGRSNFDISEYESS